MSSKESDLAQRDVRERVISAARDGRKLRILGSSTKNFLAAPPDNAHLIGADIEILSLPENAGIVSYQPSELVVTVRAATKLSEVIATLAEKKQMLGFEPPSFGSGATIGGTVASALSGPARPYLGSIRDAVLGTKIMTGKGDIARFGGEVMKNVAGYDISRLFVGSMGSLGMLLEVSLRVQPIAITQKFLCLPCNESEALREMSCLRKMSLPLTGISYAEKKLRLRLAGSEIGVSRAQHDLALFVEDDAAFWNKLNEQRLSFFDSSTPLWRLTLPYSVISDSFSGLPGERLWDWGGGLCWLKTDEPSQRVCATAKKLGGAASLFRNAGAGEKAGDEKLGALRKKLKAAFDPGDVFLSRGAWSGGTA